MPVRGDAHRAAIRSVLDAFGDDAKYLVFLGGCVLGLYARLEGAPLRTTNDVDCLSVLSPWVLQEKILSEMCSRGELSPDPQLQCRYRIRAANVAVDVLSPEGFNVGGVNRWFVRAGERAQLYDAGDGRQVMAITPPYFVATKLEAFCDRGPDAQSSKDVEDIVAVAVEIPDLVDQVEREGMRADMLAMWERAFAKHHIGLRDIGDLVDWHLDTRDGAHRARVIQTLETLAARGITG